MTNPLCPKLVMALLVVPVISQADPQIYQTVFFQNVGQFPHSSAYGATLTGVSIAVSPTYAEVTFGGRSKQSKGSRKESIRLSFLSTSPSAAIAPSGEATSTANFYYGSDPSRWLTGLRGYQALVVTNLYEGIDLQYRVSRHGIEYDFIVRPGSDPSQIRMRVRGQRVSLSANGDLISGPLIQRHPKVYQCINNRDVPIVGQFRLVGRQLVGFRVGDYDRSVSLVIDPEVAFATYLGGSRADYGHSIALTPNGEPLVVGFTLSRDFPVSNAAQPTKADGGTYGADAFVTKLSADGSRLVFSTYLGGSEDDSANSVAVTPTGQVYVSGVTESPNFPLTALRSPNPQGFLVQLDGASGRLVSSQLLPFRPVAMAYDANSKTLIFTDAFRVYRVTGTSVSTVYQGQGGSVLYNGLSADPSGGICIVGSTSARGLATSPGAYQPTFRGGSSDAFVTRLDASGNVRLNTYLGGSDSDEGYSISSDSDGACVVVGTTASDDFPQTVLLGSRANMFIARFGPMGNLLYSSYLSSSHAGGQPQVTVDGTGSAWVTSCNSGVYVHRIQRDGQRLTVSELLPFATSCNYRFALSDTLGPYSVGTRASLTADLTGALYVTGSSMYIPSTPGAFQTIYAGTGGPSFLPPGIGDAFVVKILPPGPLTTMTLPLPPGTVGVPYSQTLTASGGSQPYTWSLASGALPTGLSLTSGVIMGIPTSAGTSTFIVRVTDNTLASATQTLSLTIAPPPPPAPHIAPGGVVGGGLSTSKIKALSANAIATVFGDSFAPVGTFKVVESIDLVNGRLPTDVNGVCLYVSNALAPIFALTATQINFQVPQIPASGILSVQVAISCGAPNEIRSPIESVTASTATPEFFYLKQSPDGKNPIAAVNAVTGNYIGSADLIPGVNFVPAFPGDIVTLFFTGGGSTDPTFAPGELPSGAGSVIASVSLSIGGLQLSSSDILYVGVSPGFAGLYQLNIRVPAVAQPGNQPVVLNIGSSASPVGYLLIGLGS